MRYADAFVFLVCSLLLIAPLHARALAFSALQAIDQKVLEIDRASDQFTQTSKQDCDDHLCATVVSFWNEAGQLQKIVEKQVGDQGPAGYTARYYADCNLILVRRTPVEAANAKDLSKVEKFYFRSGKLMHITFGGDPKTFPSEQWAYYERTLNIKSVHCTIK